MLERFQTEVCCRVVRLACVQLSADLCVTCSTQGLTSVGPPSTAKCPIHALSWEGCATPEQPSVSAFSDSDGLCLGSPPHSPTASRQLSEATAGETAQALQSPTQPAQQALHSLPGSHPGPARAAGTAEWSAAAASARAPLRWSACCNLSTPAGLPQDHRCAADRRFCRQIVSCGLHAATEPSAAACCALYMALQETSRLLALAAGARSNGCLLACYLIASCCLVLCSCIQSMSRVLV